MARAHATLRLLVFSVKLLMICLVVGAITTECDYNNPSYSDLQYSSISLHALRAAGERVTQAVSVGSGGGGCAEGRRRVTLCFGSSMHAR